MTLIQLIDHLKTILEDNGGQDMEVEVIRSGMFAGTLYPGEVDSETIKVDPEAKTITFT